MIQAATLATGWISLDRLAGLAQGTTPLPDELVIDLAGGPDNLDPALARSVRDWSIVHSIYDSILDLGVDGSLLPLAAERFEIIDDLTFEVALRPGLKFHDGTPILADGIARSIAHVQQSEGPAARNFQVIERVEVIDDLTARIVTSQPAPWLPSQLAVWMVLFHEATTPDSFETAPVGSGPFRFVSREAGDHILLERNPDYFSPSAKGQPLAERVRFRFVPESATRVADLAAGMAHLIDSVPQDQAQAVVDGGGEIVEAPVLGISFLRVVNDVAPFDNPLVRQALNHAIDAETIGTALVSTEVRRLASLYPDERAIGFDSELQPFTFDPDRARELLAEAGLQEGFETRLQYTGGGVDAVMQAIAANLVDVGITVSIETTELATFNGSWQDPNSAPLRYVTWRPVYDPHTLLSLMFASTGPLSRYADERADELIASASVKVDSADRAEVYRELGRHFQESPPAVFLWNLTAIYGAKGFGDGWRPRGDEYVIPTRTENIQ
ncbi:MAG: ABC transporter substrate-binding protein [Chloroflexia bacterium]|nr:ABC transporter substrate-binding protein [Chloroflexia bacterium]